MNYCNTCILPDTRPNIIICSDGTCNACHNYFNKVNINWQIRKAEFEKLIDNIKNHVGINGYQCLIPVSGGKDSTWQVVICRDYDLKILAVTCKPVFRTEIGRRNLDNLIHLGVDHIDFSVNPKVEAKFMRKAFMEYGDPMIPIHMAIFNIPRLIAVRFRIPLIVWGENSAIEYGSKNKIEEDNVMTSSWIKQFGVTQGTTADEWVSDELTIDELSTYFGPADEDWENADIKSIFLGYYFRWDPRTSYNIAAQHGFIRSMDGPKIGIYDFADIDDDFMSIHHYLKWYKFGITRSFDNLSLEIRNGRISREKALEIIRERGDEVPLEDIEKFCEFIGITKKNFFEIIKKFRNLDIWVRQQNKWVIPNFLIKDWKW